MSRHQKKTGPRFIQLFYFMLESKAWKDLNDALSCLTAPERGDDPGE